MTKILIICGGLQIGGAEKVAANVINYAANSDHVYHYLVFEGNENAYGKDIESHGGKIITFPSPSAGYGKYIHKLNALMRKNNYDVVYSHTMFNSGINLALARINGIPVRIAHSHTTRTETTVSIAQKLYESIMRFLINVAATNRFACGIEAGRWLYGEKTFEEKGQVIHNGIDTDLFAWSEEYRSRIRKQYGVEQKFVIGHTGSLLKVKNQGFIIQRMPEILKKKPNAVLMLVGGGSDQEEKRLKNIAKDCGVSNHVIFCGPVHNVNEYLSAFDVFVFPSTREGTPLSLLEAQANGLPCIVSANVPNDAFLTDLIVPISLRNPSAWVDAICKAEREDCASYRSIVANKGYDALYAYLPIYEAFSMKQERRKPMVSLSFDDGRGDNTMILDEILLPKKIPVTLNITTGYVDQSCPKELCPSGKLPMTKEDVIRFGKSDLVEIASHGDQHQNTPEDLLEGRKKLIEWLGLNKDYRIGFASPGSGLSFEVWNSEAFCEIREQFLYMRGSYRLTSYKKLRILFRKMGRVIHLPVFYKTAYSDTKMAFKDRSNIYSACVLKDTTCAQLQALVKDCMKTGTSVTIMFHSILNDCAAEDNWSWERARFEKFCAFLERLRDEGHIDICTTRCLFEKLK